MKRPQDEAAAGRRRTQSRRLMRAKARSYRGPRSPYPGEVLVTPQYGAPRLVIAPRVIQANGDVVITRKANRFIVRRIKNAQVIGRGNSVRGALRNCPGGRR